MRSACRHIAWCTLTLCVCQCEQVNEFDGYQELQFNPSHSSLGQKSALISGKTWLVNVGMDIFACPNLLLRDVLILGVTCVIFWVGGFTAFDMQKYVR